MPLPADFSLPQQPEAKTSAAPTMPEINMQAPVAAPEQPAVTIPTEATPNVPLSTPDTLPSISGMPTNEVTQMPPLPGSIETAATAVPEVSTDAPLTESGDPSIQQATPEGAPAEAGTETGVAMPTGENPADATNPEPAAESTETTPPPMGLNLGATNVAETASATLPTNTIAPTVALTQPIPTEEATVTPTEQPTAATEVPAAEASPTPTATNLNPVESTPTEADHKEENGKKNLSISPETADKIAVLLKGGEKINPDVIIQTLDDALGAEQAEIDKTVADAEARQTEIKQMRDDLKGPGAADIISAVVEDITESLHPTEGNMDAGMKAFSDSVTKDPREIIENPDAAAERYTEAKIKDTEERAKVVETIKNPGGQKLVSRIFGIIGSALARNQGVKLNDESSTHEEPTPLNTTSTPVQQAA